MTGERAREERDRAGVGLRTAAVLASTLWGAAVVGLFLGRQERLASGFELLETLALAALATYSFTLLGWRLRGFLCARTAGELSRLEGLLLDLALGLAAVAMLLFAAGLLGLYGPPLAWALVVLPLLGPQGRFLEELSLPRGGARPGAASPLAAAILAVIGFVTLAAALAPATSQDALVYHLALPARYIETGRLEFVETSFFSAFPQNVEMLYVLGLLLQGERLAKWFHWLLGLAAAGAVAVLAAELAGGRRRGGARPGGAGALAAALFATVPTVALIAGWAYADLGVVFFTTLSVHFFLRWWDRARREDPGGGLAGPSRDHLLQAGLLAGAAAGCKYTAAIQALVLAALVGVVGFLEGRRLRAVAAQAGLASLGAAALAAPWLLRNWAVTGNPVYPFAYALFGGRGWDAERAAVLSRFLSGWGGDRAGWDLLALPWDLVMEGDFFSEERFDGVVGPAFLAGLPLVLLAVWRRPGCRLALTVVLLHALGWAASTHQVRFLLPALAVLSSLVAAGWASVRSRAARRLQGFVLQAAVALNVVTVLFHFAAHNPLPVVLGLEEPEQYLEREVPGGDYAVFAHIERHLPRASRILFGSCGNPGFLCKRPYHSDAIFENRTLAAFLRAARGPADLARRLAAGGFTHLLFRFDCVFDPRGRKSEIPLEHQQLLGECLNRHGRLECEAGGTVLYAVDPPPPEAAELPGETGR